MDMELTWVYWQWCSDLVKAGVSRAQEDGQ